MNSFNKANNLKTIVIVHGWTGSSKRDWMRWLARELRAQGFRVIVPDMPIPRAPVPIVWVPYLKHAVGTIDENTFFVGHSVGCQAIMRMLARQDRKSGGAIFVAGFFKTKDFLRSHPWLKSFQNFYSMPYHVAAKYVIRWWETRFDYARLRKNIPKSVVILSDNDHVVDEKLNAELFHKHLNSEIIIIKNGGHLTGPEGFRQFPMLVEEVLKMTRDEI